MIDLKALADLSYGLFIVSSYKDGKFNGLIANSVFQVTAEPPQLAVALNKESLTHEYIKSSGKFCVQPLKETAQMPFIGIFGFRKGKEFDKFSKVSYKVNTEGLAVVTENTLAALCVEVKQKIDLGTHTMFIGPITFAEVLCSDCKPLTYDYYQNALKGKTPKGATTFKDYQGGVK